MADTNRTQLYYVEETFANWGTTPACNPTQLRMTGESLGFNISNIVSNEIRSDRQTTDLVQTGAENSGGINGEMSYGAYDDFLEGTLMGTWSDSITTTCATLTFIFTNSVLAGGAGTVPFTGLSVGQWFRLTGASSATNNGYHMITTYTSAQTVAVANSTIATEAAGETITIYNGGKLKNGITMKSFSIQRTHADMTNPIYFKFYGMCINSCTFNVEAEQISTITFDFIGKDTSIGSGSSDGQQFVSNALMASYHAAAANDVMNGVSHCAQIMTKNPSTGAYTAVNSALIRGLNFTVANNIRGKKTIGSLGNSGIGAGKVDVTGTMSAFFLDQVMYDRYLNGDETGLTFKLEDTPAGHTYGNAYIFTFPRIKFESDTVNAGGADADVMEEISWRAIRHATFNYTMQIDRFVKMV